MKVDKPVVSIITPSYNQAEFLKETINSVLSQDYPAIEYIVVDGGSADGSLEIVRSYELQLSHWVSEEDMGQTDAINKGFDMASGDICAWLNSDDTLLPGAVSSAVQFLEENKWVGMVYSNAYYIDGAGERIARYPAGPTDYKGLRRGVNTIPQQTMFFRSILWDMVGPLDPSFYYAMDYDLWVRLAAVTPIAYHEEYWANFRLHSESKSKTAAKRCWPEMMRVHYREGGSKFSVLYAKYLVRKVVEPLMPLRIKARAPGVIVENSNKLDQSPASYFRISKNGLFNGAHIGAMHILILHMRYAPDATGTGPLITQLATDLVGTGEQVTVITSVPHYGQSAVPSEYRQGLLYRQIEDGVVVWRTGAFPWLSGRVIGRVIDYALYTILAFWASLRAERPDVILAIAPPITVGPLGWMVSVLRQAPLAYNAQDIWPDGLIRMGRLQNSLAIRLFGCLESWIYRQVDSIVVVSEGMEQNLLRKQVPEDKIRVIHNWVDLEAIHPKSKDNSFSREHELVEKFVVLFAGNLGFAAGLEVVLEAADHCRDEADLIFLLVGQGSAREALERQAHEMELENIGFLPTQPLDRLSEMLASSDLSLVTLRPGMGGLSVPSKTYAYMASGRPILAAVPLDSAIRLLIYEAACGRSVSADDAEQLCRAIINLKGQTEALKEMGQRARRFAERRCGRQVAAARYHEHLRRLAVGEAA